MVENDFSGLECKGYIKHKTDLKSRLRSHSQIISMDKRVFQNLKLEAFLIKDAQLCCLHCLWEISFSLASRIV